MRRFLASLIFLVLAAFAALPAMADPPIPPLTGRIVDLANLLPEAKRQSLTATVEDYDRKTTNEIVVVTLPSLEDYPIEDWGLALGRGWGIGKAGKNNGVLLIVAPKDRELRIEVGYGLEGDLPDAIAKRIIDETIVPYFKRGDMDGGIEAGVEAIIAALSGSYEPPRINDLTSRFSNFMEHYSHWFIVGIFVLSWLPNLLRWRWDKTRHRYVWHPNVTVSWSGSGSSSSSSSSRSYSGGGGSFGGGGASGRW